MTQHQDVLGLHQTLATGFAQDTCTGFVQDIASVLHWTLAIGFVCHWFCTRQTIAELALHQTIAAGFAPDRHLLLVLHQTLAAGFAPDRHLLLVFAPDDCHKHGGTT